MENVHGGYGVPDGGSRQTARGDRGAVRGALAGATFHGPTPGLPPERRLLPHRRSARAHGRRRAPGRRRDDRPRHRGRPDAGGRGRAAPAPRPRPGLPADGDRHGTVPAPDPARGGRRRRARARDVRARHSDHRATGGRAARPRRPRLDRGGGVSEPTLETEVEPTGQSVELPAALPVLPLKETVVFPQSMTPLAVGQERSVRLIDDVVSGERLLVLIASRDPEIEAPGWDDIYDVGTAAIVHKMIKVPDGTLRILVQGLERVRLEN